MDPSNQYQCNNNGGRSSSTSPSFLCRQSSSRWIPTADQIRILRELYYTNGVRSPTAEQIQRNSARLRQYGKIEGKNVFYWFQNHKARERQKKKLTMDNNITHNNNIINSDSNKFNTHTNVVPNYGISSGLHDVGYDYGGSPTAFMERSIRDSSMSLGGGDHGSVVMEPTMPWMYHYIKDEDPPTMVTRQIQTLPLFPTHSKDQEEEEDKEDDDSKYCCNNIDYCAQLNGYHACYLSTATSVNQNQDNYHHHYTANGAAASLELTLNSYYCSPQGFNSM
ncbi:uncharacterized protein A4U43_C07F27280 [Asparagus officinalis]|uniref:Homeobox domain-containing protein n=1 Tax=Asparagus officinalis TaxID=4686 RepID=A0A5P1EFC8_ASPOF|nr:uncharacterized protein A4U43_C07F27280 [Asparagus officinalis]